MGLEFVINNAAWIIMAGIVIGFLLWFFNGKK